MTYLERQQQRAQKFEEGYRYCVLCDEQYSFYKTYEGASTAVEKFRKEHIQKGRKWLSAIVYQLHEGGYIY